MVALTGYIQESCLSPPKSIYVTSDFSDYSLPLWPPTAATVSEVIQASLLSKNYPIETRELTKTGVQVTSFFNDYYNRIHINPKALNLGNIVTAQQAVARVWNAYMVPKNLLELTGETDGVSVSGPISAPASWPALQEQEWTLDISPDGASALDIELKWIFSGESVALPITGVRIVGWPFLHNWNSSIIEVLTWATNILASRSGMEQRRALRLLPRRTFEKEYLVELRERQLFESLLAGWGSRVFALQLEQDIQLLSSALSVGDLRINCVTADRDFQVGSLVMLYADAFNLEVAEIAGVDVNGVDLARPLQMNWAEGSKVYPAKPARMQEQPSIKRLSNTIAQWAASWLVMSINHSETESPEIIYRSFPVFDLRPDETRELAHSMQRLLLELDNGTSTPQYLDTADLGFALREHIDLSDKASHTALRKILHYLAGRFKSVWVPTWADDLTVTQTIANTATQLVIENIGYTRYCLYRPGRQDIRIELFDGTVFYRRVTDSVETSSDIETLTFDSALGQTVPTAEITRVSYLILCRGDSDSVRIEHDTDDAVRTAVRFRGVRDDL